MVKKNLFQRLMTLASQLRSSAAPHSSPDKVEKEFRYRISGQRKSGKISNLETVTSLGFMAMVVEELLHSSREHVIFCGDTLPAYVFLTPGVRSAMRTFLRRNPKARITVITNEFSRSRTYVEQLAEFDDVVMDTARITMLPLRQDYVVHGYQMVVADSKPAPSVWYREREGSDSYYQFHSDGIGVVQQGYLRGIIAEFGSPR